MAVADAESTSPPLPHRAGGQGGDEDSRGGDDEDPGQLRRWRPRGVMANVVAPGPMRTELFFAGKDEAFVRKAEERSMGRIAETTDVASGVELLLSDAASWVNGQVIRVNGGFA